MASPLLEPGEPPSHASTACAADLQSSGESAAKGTGTAFPEQPPPERWENPGGEDAHAARGTTEGIFVGTVTAIFDEGPGSKCAGAVAPSEREEHGGQRPSAEEGPGTPERGPRRASKRPGGAHWPDASAGPPALSTSPALLPCWRRGGPGGPISGPGDATPRKTRPLQSTGGGGSQGPSTRRATAAGTTASVRSTAGEQALTGARTDGSTGGR